LANVRFKCGGGERICVFRQQQPVLHELIGCVRDDFGASAFIRIAFGE
jgi:hypothetical protein